MSERAAYATIRNGVFCRLSDGAELANGCVAPIKCYYVADDPVREVRWVEFAVQLSCSLSAGDKLPVVTVDLREGILRQLERQQPLLRIYKTTDRKHLEADILEDVRSMNGVPCPYFARHGPIRLNGKWVYVCGDEVIGLPPNAEYKIAPDVATKHLTYDPSLDPRDTVERFDRLLRGKGVENSDAIAAVYLILWLFMLITAFRSVIEDESMTTFLALLVVGKHDTRKTSAARMLTTLFDLKPDSGAFPNEFNADSGFKAIAAATKNVPDQIILVDDVTIVGIEEKETRQREETAQQLVRFCVNSSEQAVLTSRTTATTRKFSGGLVMTGESLLSGASTNDRIINVMVEDMLATTSEEGHTLAATTFRLFIEWCLPRLPALLEDLRCHCATLQEEDNLRLKRVAELMLWMLNAWYDFTAEVAGFSNTKKAKRIQETGTIIVELMNRQAELVNRIDQQQPEGNVLYYLRKCYKRHDFKIVMDKDDWHPKESVFIKKSNFLVSPEYLLRVITDKTPLQFSTEKALGKALDKLNLLAAQEADKHTIKRYGKRVYNIDLSKIMDNMED